MYTSEIRRSLPYIPEGVPNPRVRLSGPPQHALTGRFRVSGLKVSGSGQAEGSSSLAFIGASSALEILLVGCYLYCSIILVPQSLGRLPRVSRTRCQTNMEPNKWSLTLRVQSTQICGIYGFYTRNRASDFGSGTLTLRV